GTLQCITWKDGKALWTERLGGGVWGSLVHADGRFYVTLLDGETVVVAAKPKFEVLAKNPLKERTLSSIAISDGHLFIRTYKHLVHRQVTAAALRSNALQIRNSKHQIPNKYEIQSTNDRNAARRSFLSFELIWVCLGFGASNFVLGTLVSIAFSREHA